MSSRPSIAPKHWVSIERLIESLQRELVAPDSKPPIGYYGQRLRPPAMDRENVAKREARLTKHAAIHYRRKSA